jgi:uncharacterized membrane protein
MRVTSGGHAAFAAIMIAVGVQGLSTGQFTAVWQPVPRGLPAREILAYLCAFISLASGIGLLWSRTAGSAARVLFASLLLWLLIFRGRDIFHAPGTFAPWDGSAETAVMVSAAWVLYAWFAEDGDRQRVGVAVGDVGVRIARVLFGLALVAFGSAHFVYLRDTAALVPRLLPAPVAWACVTGGAFIAAGIAVLTRVQARLAATLAALQIGLCTLLVWVPIVAGGSKDASQWSEFVDSLALTAAAWVVADSYRVR